MSYLEFITQPTQGNDKLSIFLQIASKHFDMRVHRTVVAVKIKPPYVVKELFTGQSNPLIADKIEKQLVFLRGKLGFVPIHIDVSADHIHFNARGEYMQSCLFFGFFFEKDPLEIKYVPKEISADEAKLLREVASKTLKEFKQPRDLK